MIQPSCENCSGTGVSFGKRCPCQPEADTYENRVAATELDRAKDPNPCLDVETIIELIEPFPALGVNVPIDEVILFAHAVRRVKPTSASPSDLERRLRAISIALTGKADSSEGDVMNCIDKLSEYFTDGESLQTAANTAKDAARWRMVLTKVGGRQSYGCSQSYTLFTLPPALDIDILKGGVAGHFTATVDAAIAAVGNTESTRSAEVGP